MAIYDTSKYGSGVKYGQVYELGVYYNSQLTAKAVDYTTTRISWKTFLIDPNDGTPNSSWYWRLVKNYRGSSDNPYEGIFIAGDQYAGSGASFPLEYLDYDEADSGLEVTYTLWLFTPNRWISCGTSTVTSVPDSNSLITVSSWLPRAWLNAGDAEGEIEPTNTLAETLSALVFSYDELRAKVNTLSLTSNHTHNPTALLKQKVTEVGFTYEPTLGDSYHRSLYSASSYVNQYKGTLLGIKTYITALTHLGSKVVQGNNRLTSVLDSSFYIPGYTTDVNPAHNNYGDYWSGTTYLNAFSTYSGWNLGTTASVRTYDEESVTPPKVLTNNSFLPGSIAFMKVLGGTASSYTTFWDTPAEYSWQSDFISVLPNTRYVFSGWVKQYAGSTSNQVSVAFEWFDIYGNPISITDSGYFSAHPSTITTITNSWTEFTSPSDQARDGVLSPTRAALVKVIILFYSDATSSSDKYAITYLQLAESKKSFEFQDARTTQIYLQGEKENYLPNPNFAETSSSWNAVLGGDPNTYYILGSVDRDTTTTAAAVQGNTSGTIVTGSARATSEVFTGAGLTAFVSDWVAVDPGQIFTFSGYVLGSRVQNAIARIEFSTQIDAVTQTKILVDSYGPYYPTDPYLEDSDPVEISTTEVTRLAVSAIAPPSSVDTDKSPLAKVSVYFPDAEAGDQFWLSGTMLEPAQGLNSYFSGSGGTTAFPINPNTEEAYYTNDCIWETKNIYNYFPNPVFNYGTTGWVFYGASIEVVSNDGAGYDPLPGNDYFGKVTYGPLSDSYMPLSLPFSNGEYYDYTISAYVRGAGTYSFSNTYTKPFVIEETTTEWTRIYATYRDAKTNDINIALAVSGGTSYHITGLQVEYGRIVNKFINPNDSTTVELAGPYGSIYASNTQSINGGKSTYINNYGTKISRLRDTIDTVLPNYAAWQIIPGIPDIGYTDLTNSLIPSASFEMDLGNWSAYPNSTDTTLSRIVSQGSLVAGALESPLFINYGISYVTHGQAWCRVTNFTSDQPAGIVSERIPIEPEAGYYCSAAYMFYESLPVTLKVTFYDSADSEIYTKTTTQTGNAINRWNYISDTYSQTELIGATYAVITIYTDITDVSYFEVDRVVFRR